MRKLLFLFSLLALTVRAAVVVPGGGGGGGNVTNVVIANQWWTNNHGGFLYPNFQRVLDTTGATPGPSIVIRTNDGSVFIGPHVNQDISMGTANPQIYHFHMTDSNDTPYIFWEGMVTDSTNYNHYADWLIQANNDKDNARAALTLDSFPTNHSNIRQLQLSAYSVDNAIHYAINLNPAFTVGPNGDLTMIKSVDYRWPTTNGMASYGLVTDGGGPQQLYWTNVASLAAVTNIINNTARIGPGTVNYWAKFTSTTNVGDSVVRQPTTNLVEYRMNPSGGTAFTNNFTNAWYSEYSAEATNEGLYIISSHSSSSNPGSRQHEIKGFQNGSTNGIVPLTLNAAMQIEPGSNPISGHTAGNVSPVADNQYTFGSTSARWLSVTAGARGFSADAYTNSGSVLTLAAGGSGFGIAADRIDVWQSSGPAKVVTLFTNINGGAKTMYGPNGGLAIGDVFGTPNTFLTHNALDVANTWQMGTNHNSATTRGPTTYLHGVASDDNAQNRAGGNAFFVGGPASGNGTNGSVGIATYNKGASGFGYNTVVPRVFAAAVPVSLTTNSATLFLNITLPTALKSMGGAIHAHTEISDGTDVATKDEQFVWSAIRKSTTVTTAISASANSSTVASGTLAISSTTFTAVANAQTVDLKCNLVTTGGNANTAVIMYTISFNGTAASAFVEQ